MKVIKNESNEPLKAKKIKRNAKCSCGSGKKAKKCCGANTTYYSKIKTLLKKNLNFDLHLVAITSLPNSKSWNVSLLRVTLNKYIGAFISITRDSVHGNWHIEFFYQKKVHKMKDNKYMVLK